ncbi:response regulator [sulfur-oxidizing endosymbiont of Gigantopelta aegis]|uniref:response regulator n=1 Tax=sulfur-oxidizing endosymbiont of Gigantopelta aegis TaxID=2794934 RepID=UPI0018DC45B6|nr:response regulator [sulfur-oxidizing endosymbiont of Gigantopelta aegis]
MLKKILVVDDEAVLTKMIKMNLERTGNYEVRTENQGSKALQATREFKPDLIFMDVMMPDMSGDEAIAEIREDDNLASIPYVFLTAIVTKAETEDMGNTIGGNEFLAKPVKTDELIETIERILEK